MLVSFSNIFLFNSVIFSKASGLDKRGGCWLGSGIIMLVDYTDHNSTMNWFAHSHDKKEELE